MRFCSVSRLKRDFFVEGTRIWSVVVGRKGVSLSMIPLLEVAYSKCQEEEKDKGGMQGQGQRGAWQTRQEQEDAGKKRKRSSNWSEAETLQLLLLRKGQLQSKEERKSCPKGSSAWDEIASQLKEKFTPRSGKHVGERWDTLRRVYMDIEEHCSKTQETYAETGIRLNSSPQSIHKSGMS
jgi:hypothetical protein